MPGRFFLNGKTWPGFFFAVLVGIARGGGGNRTALLRCVRFGAHAKSCSCWGRFFFDGEVWPGFHSSVLVVVENLGTTVYTIAWLFAPWTTSWGGCCGGFLGARMTFPVEGMQVGKRGQCQVNPGKTCLLAYNGGLVLRKTSAFLGPPALGR